MVRINYGRLATGIVFLALFLGFELHIPAIQSLIPGSYAGLTTGNYLGFGFLVTALGALGAAFSTTPSYAGPSAGSRSGAAGADPYALAAAMMAMQQGQSLRPASAGAGALTTPGPSPTAACPACGAGNIFGAKFCQACGRMLSAPVVASPSPVAPTATLACPACGAPNLPGAKFCQGCGKAISGSPSA